MDQSTKAKAGAQRSTYQHGNLPAALSDAIFELVAEKGIKGFSVVEAARRSGVSSAAPYRHFANRDELLAAVAAIVYGQLVEEMRQARSDAGDGAAQLVAITTSYVRFAIANRPGIDILFRGGLAHADHAELARYDDLAYAEYRGACEVMGLVGDDAHRLVFAAAALAHGFAMLEAVATAGYAMPGPVALEAVADATRRLAAGYVR